MQIFNQSLQTLEQTLALRLRNQQVIAANLANADTPGYQAQKMDFAGSLERAMAGAAEPAVIEPSEEPTLTLNGNNVNMETELGALSRNRLMHTVTTQLLSAQFRQLSTALEAER